MIDTNLNTFNQMYAALKKPKMNFALKLHTLFLMAPLVRQWDPFKSYLFSTIKLFLLANVKPLNWNTVPKCLHWWPEKTFFQIQL